MQNFSLIAIKESRDVDRLTRVSLLITKVTILFLPVSLMTSYFSCNLADTVYTPTQYWVAFTVVLCSSFLVLLLFGVLSGTMDHSLLRSIGSAMYRRVMRKRLSVSPD